MIIHICPACRKAKGTQGPYENIIDSTTYFLCYPCWSEQEAEWLTLMDALIEQKGDPFDDPIFN